MAEKEAVKNLSPIKPTFSFQTRTNVTYLSNIELLPKIASSCSKKRGLYVEKKTVEETTEKPSQLTVSRSSSPERQPSFINRSVKQPQYPPASYRHLKSRPPPRPKPEQKQFISNVLQLLSQASTATQCPQEEPANKKKKPTKARRKLVIADELFHDELEDYNDEVRNFDIDEIKEKKESDDVRNFDVNVSNFKSKILEEYLPSKKLREEEVVVLQSNDLSESVTPSMNSEDCSIKDDNNGKKTVLQAILEGKESSKEESEESFKRSESNQNDESRKKLFLDLHAVPTRELNKESSVEELAICSDDSKISFHSNISPKAEPNEDKNLKAFIHNSSATNRILKLNNRDVDDDDSYVEKYINLNNPEFQDDPAYYTGENDYIDFNRPTVLSESDVSVVEKKPKKKAKRRAYFFGRPVDKSLPKSSSFRAASAKSVKRNLLSVIKKELYKDTDYMIQEPADIFDALRLMAQNKKQESIEEEHLQTHGGTCRLRNRKVLSSKRKHKQSLHVTPETYEDFNEISIDMDDLGTFSHRSINVRNLDVGEEYNRF